MNDEWEHAVQFIGKRPVRGHEVAAPLDGERTVESIVGRMVMFQGILASTTQINAVPAKILDSFCNLKHDEQIQRGPDLIFL